MQDSPTNLETEQQFDSPSLHKMAIDGIYGKDTKMIKVLKKMPKEIGLRCYEDFARLFNARMQVITQQYKDTNNTYLELERLDSTEDLDPAMPLGVIQLLTSARKVLESIMRANSNAAGSEVVKFLDRLKYDLEQFDIRGRVASDFENLIAQ